MAYPTKPSLSTSYTAVEQSLGDGTFPGQELDVDLAALKSAIEGAIDFIQGVTRSDGRLANQSVSRETLAEDILLGFGAPSAWVTGTAYVVPNTVFFDSVFYVCAIDHTANADFNVDLGSGRWVALVDFGVETAAAEAARDAAAASASAAASSASAAGTSATNAAGSATSASGSATAAAGSASNAASSASAAASSASAASTSETNAAASETAAAASAASAAASFDSFDDRYLGAKTADPTLDNDGNALIAGALYFNTTVPEMRVYTGSAWVAAGSAVNGTTRRQSFTASAGQTTFTVTGGYDAGFVDVYLNGVKLVNGTDVTVTSGTDVVLAVGAAAGDSVDVVAYGAFEVANTYTQAEVDAKLAPLTGRNLIINGSGRINQRAYVSGTATGTANQYTLDRWRVVVSGQSLTFTGDDSRRVMTAPAGGVEQVVEGRNVVGGSYVLNWDGTATATVDGVARAKGEVFTLTANTNVTIRFAGGTFSDVQLESGVITTPFEHNDFGEELRRCQRFVCKSYDLAVAPGANTDVGILQALSNGLGVFSESVRFPVMMRAGPTITLYNPTGGASTLSVGATVGQSGFFAAQTGGAADSSTRFHYLAVSEL